MNLDVFQKIPISIQKSDYNGISIEIEISNLSGYVGRIKHYTESKKNCIGRHPRDYWSLLEITSHCPHY